MFEYAQPSVVAVPSPAAGGGFTYAVPGSERQLIACVSFQLVTAVAVANRLVVATLLGGDGVRIGRFSSGFTQAASLTTVYTFAVGVQSYGANDAANIGAPLAPLWLPDGGSLAVTLVNGQAADQVSVVRVTVYQYPSDDDDG